MFDVFNPEIVVLITTTHGEKLEQIYLNRDEQHAVIGFIKEMKKLNNKEVEIINGATNFVKCLGVANSSWDSIENIVSNYNENIERSR